MAEPIPCAICGRKPQTVNTEHRECSHVDCPHRPKQWSDGAPNVITRRRDEMLPGEAQIDWLFDHLG